jgi:hypothetical protein
LVCKNRALLVKPNTSGLQQIDELRTQTNMYRLSVLTL